MMARQSHTPLTALGTKTDAYSANAADLTMTAADTVNNEQVTLTGNELVIAHNTDGVNPYTVTVSSVVDDMGRDGDISAYSLAAGEYGVFGPLGIEGWRQSDGKLYFEGSNAAIKFGVIKLVR
jgi:hypothetical protein